MRFPDFFIVGAPKAGTTALNHFLSKHPDVFMAPVKECHYFATDLTKSSKYVADLDTYLWLFSEATTQKRVGEASALYLYSKAAPTAIKSFNSAAQIIIALRNPIELIYSYYSQNLYGGAEDIDDFEDAVRLENSRKRGHNIPRGVGIHDSLFYQDIGKLHEQVHRYFSVFDRRNIHIIVFDDFKLSPTQEYNKLMQFLGIDCSYRAPNRIINPNTVPRSRLLSRWLHSWIFVPHWALAHRSLWKARRKALRALIRLNTVARPRPLMHLCTRDFLREIFADDIRALSKLVGRDLTYWIDESF